MNERQKVPHKNFWTVSAFPVAEKLKGWVKSFEDSIQSVIMGPVRRKKSNPIDILKRLQREAFSDLMKLRDRQDKVEQAFVFLKSTKGGSFEETNTNVKGEVSVSGSLLLANDDFEKDCDILDKAGVRTGVQARFTFDTIVRKKDALIAELVTELSGLNVNQDACASPMSLKKVMYLASITDWLSLIVIPFGARCEDIGTISRPIHGFTNSSASAPPIFCLHHKYAAGIAMKKSNIAVSLAELGDASGMDQAPMGYHSSLAQLFCQLSEGKRLGLSFLHCRPSSLTQRIRLAPLGMTTRTSLTGAAGNTKPTGVPMQSIALVAESALDESLRISGWIEMQKSHGTSLQWAVSLSDCPKDEIEWNVSIGQMMSDQSNLLCANLHGRSKVQFQLEAFLRFSIGKSLSLQPGFVYLSDGEGRSPALLFRSNWSF